MSTENKNIKITTEQKKGESTYSAKKMNKIKIQQKIDFFFKIITDTIISVEKYKTNDILSASELNLCIQNLENIYKDLKNIENSIQANHSNSTQIISKLQTINDDISIVFKTFGTNKIKNVLTVCYGNDFIHKIQHNLDKEKLALILNFVQPISYKILPWKNKPKNKNTTNKIIKNKIIEDFMIVEMGENLDCYDLCRTSNNFYTKVFGIKVVFQNTEKKIQLLFVVFLPNYCYHV